MITPNTRGGKKELSQNRKMYKGVVQLVLVLRITIKKARAQIQRHVQWDVLLLLVCKINLCSYLRKVLPT